MRLGLVDFVVLPTKTLARKQWSASLSVLPSRLHNFDWRLHRVGRVRTWVMPIDRHSSSQSSFRVPLDESK